MRNIKVRLFLILIVLGVISFGFVLTVVVNALDLSSALPLYPTLGKEAGITAQYSVEESFQEKQLEITVASVEGDAAKVEEVFSANGEVLDTKTFYLDSSTGYLQTTNNNEELFSLYWVNLYSLPLAEGQSIPKRDLPGLEFKAKDSTGLIGNVGEDYIIRITDTFVWWSDNLNSQASVRVEVESLKSNGEIVARGVYDLTSGQLFQMTFFKDAKFNDLELLKSNFPHSKNRYYVNNTIIITSILVMLFFLIYAFIIRNREGVNGKQSGKLDTMQNPSIPQAFASTKFLVLLGLGLLTFYVDIIVDIWFYSYVGTSGLVIIHILLLLLYVVSFFYVLGKDRIRFLLIGLIELGFPLTFYVAVEPTIWPAISTFPGLSIMWLVLVFLEGYEFKKEY